MRQPVLVDVLGAFTDERNEELRARHARYGQKIKELSDDGTGSLLVLSKSRHPLGFPIEDREGLRIRSIGSSRNLWALGRNAAKVAREETLPITWIAGTPFREAIACRTANQILPGRLQIQAHGDFGGLSPYHGKPTSRLRWLMAKSSLRSADSIRAVAPLQLSHLAESFKLDRDKCFVAPVPINKAFLDHETKITFINSPPKIGYFGRIHSEKGLQLWAQIAHELHETNTALEFHIIGDGPDFASFQNELTSRISSDLVHFHGTLHDSQLVAYVSSLSFVLSTCSKEAFGRSILEALALGVPVASVSSPGSNFIMKIFKPKHLHVADVAKLPGVAKSLISNYPENTNVDFLEALRLFEESNVQLVAQSWI